MAKQSLFLCFLVFLFFTSFCQGGKRWCVIDEWAEEEDIDKFLQIACHKHKENYCYEISPGRPCFLPYNNRSHGSYVVNLMYNKVRVCPPHLAMITSYDPSYGNCTYPYREGEAANKQQLLLPH